MTDQKWNDLSERTAKRMNNIIKEQEKIITKLNIEKENEFATGVVYALARLVEMFDQPTFALDILRESDVDVSKAIEYDVAFLREHNPNLPKGKE